MMGDRARDPLLVARGLEQHFPIRRGLFGRSEGSVQAVDGVDLEIMPGETLGLVGESGCGKSTLGRTLLRLHEPTAGRITFDGHDIAGLSRSAMKTLRRDMQMIFQDPAGSLDPRMTVRRIIGEGLDVHDIASGGEREKIIRQTLDRVGLPIQALDRYPHEFSGGQHQRIGIARALVLAPRFLVADEPVSALDVSVQSQVLNLLVELRRDLDLTYLFIAHDLAVVAYISDRIAVMYLGKIVEVAPAREVYTAPLHPYTQALLSAVPEPRPDDERQPVVLGGDVPSATDPPSGCRFRTRCPLAQQICADEEPPLVSYSTGHQVACHFAGTPIASGATATSRQAPGSQ